MEHDFRRRCEAALTHPVTLAALALLLVNDVVFKTLFPGAWAVGKLSDLAWVIFASPLLAFALSFAVPKKSAAGRRVALFVAYGGLPILYAAFNTFAPVHDAIMGVLTLGADGAASGSPMDATDSLVIPFGLAIAAWTWRRGVPTGGLRSRFAALAAGIAALASLASPCGSYPGEEGVTYLSVADDGAVFASGPALPPYAYRSDDGGMSWSWHDKGFFPVVGAPTGKYAIGDSGIELKYGRRELVYSTEYLRGDANKWAQENDTRDLGYRVLATRPRNVLYHADSGSVIAAMGIQGVVAGTPDGRWHRVAVGRHSPTDFSFAAKTRTFLESSWRVGIVAAALSLSALTIAATTTSAYQCGEKIGGLFVILAALGGCLGTILVIVALNELHLIIPILALPAALLSWMNGIIAISKSMGGGGAT